MYRLTAPKIVIFIPILILGIVLTIITPKYLGAIRIISLVALLIGELGLSFIPVLAFYPKVNPIQGLILGVVYFFTTFIICFATWGINDFSNIDSYAFLFKNGEFYINTHALFVANIFALIELLLNFRLVYDEDLAKQSQQKRKPHKDISRSQLSSFSKPLLKRPEFEKTASSTSSSKEKVKSSSKSDMDIREEFLKPFEFEPQVATSVENLPEESRGKLFSDEVKEEKYDEKSDFFGTEEKDEWEESEKPSEVKTVEKVAKVEQVEKVEKVEKIEKIEKPKPIQINPFPPSDIKKDLAAIFEQYSSLDAVKKLTANKVAKPISNRIEEDKSKRKPYTLPKPQIAVHIEGQDVVDASFRQISEAEKLEEIKDEIKKELQETVTQETQKIEETMQKTSNTKDEIIESLKNIKEELILSLKEEIKKEFVEEQQNIKRLVTENEKDDEVEEEINKRKDADLPQLNEQLDTVNKHPQTICSAFIDFSGKILVAKQNDNQILLTNEHGNILAKSFSNADKEISKTNQGNLCNLLLESDDGTLVLAKTDDRLLGVLSKGKGEIYTANILRLVSEVEEG